MSSAGAIRSVDDAREALGPPRPPYRPGSEQEARRRRAESSPPAPAEVARLARAWGEELDRLAAERLRRRCASGEAAADAAVLEGARERAEAARYRAQVKRLAAERARLGLDAGQGVEVVERARRYLATIPACGSRIYDAAIALVRGLALAEDVALELLRVEYVPRMRVPVGPAELRGVVRRAGRASRVGYGWLLERR